MGSDNRQYGLERYAHFFTDPEDRAPMEQWKLRAKCLDTPSLLDMFHASTDEDAPPEEVNEARAITRLAKRFCKGQGTGLEGDNGKPCRALNDCLEYALENRIWAGVWGGTSYRERRKMSTQYEAQVSIGTRRRSR